MGRIERLAESVKGRFRVAQSANDMKAHEQTYGGFINLLKWALPAIGLITIVVVLLIA